MQRVERIYIGGRRIEYRLRQSPRANKLRVRVGLAGIDVIQPPNCKEQDVKAFLRTNEDWLFAQVDRVASLQPLLIQQEIAPGTILFNGEATRVDVVNGKFEGRLNQIHFGRGALTIMTPPNPRTPPARTLENWLRKQAREALQQNIAVVAERLNVAPGRLYIMDQRTKWGNCSSLGNLSFSWRLIMAPEHVLRYLVTHETVHLAIPNHSQRFWLTVQSMCPEVEDAKEWLAANGDRLMIDLNEILLQSTDRGGTSRVQSPPRL